MKYSIERETEFLCFYFQDMVQKYVKDLELNEPDVLEALEALRLHALEKLTARNKFQNEGIASIKIKLAGNVPTQVDSKCYYYFA